MCFKTHSDTELVHGCCPLTWWVGFESNFKEMTEYMPPWIRKLMLCMHMPYVARKIGCLSVKTAECIFLGLKR